MAMIVLTAVAVGTGVKGARVAGASKDQRGLPTAGLVLGIVTGVLEKLWQVSLGRP
jgi:hypothetical protein